MTDSSFRSLYTDLNNDGVTPPESVSFDLHIVHTTESGDSTMTFKTENHESTHFIPGVPTSQAEQMVDYASTLLVQGLYTLVELADDPEVVMQFKEDLFERSTNGQGSAENGEASSSET